jgi:hypothetical protein
VTSAFKGKLPGGACLSIIGTEGKRFPQFGFIQRLPTFKGRRGVEDAPQATDVTTHHSTNISRRLQPLGEGRQLSAGA